MGRFHGLIAFAAALAALAGGAHAQVAAPAVDSGDTAWLLASAALVMLMTPGLALFYGGMVRRKNVLGTVMQSFVALGVISVLWTLIGYSLAFAPSVGGVIGGLDFVGLRGVGQAPSDVYATTTPHLAFMIFQMMFAVITPALITGAFAERFKFSTYLVFLGLWSLLVYVPLAHWVWNPGGWLFRLGALDFAGGLVVHISSGVAALAAALLVGKRRGYLVEPMAPHNLTLTLLGAGLLWFGWFGFNAGSAVSSGGLAASAFVATHVASAAAALSWMFGEWALRGKPTALGVASGAVAGLVAITPASGFVTPLPALVIGLVAGVLCLLAVNWKTRLGYDDSLDAVGVHGVGGTWGALATGLFASASVNSAGADGLLLGNPALLGKQALSVVVAWVYAFAVTTALLKILDGLMGLRVSEEEESYGLDLTQHGEAGYTL